MTKEQLDAIRARLDMATPGEWRIEYGDRGWTVWVKTTATGSMRIARVGYANFDGLNADLIANAPTDLRHLLAEVERLRDAHAMAVQVSGELCEKCGWAMRFPSEKCRCELLAEVEQLNAEVEFKIAQNVALVGMNGRLQQEVERLTALGSLQSADIQRLTRRVAEDDADWMALRAEVATAFARGVAAMREAAASYLEREYDGSRMIAVNIRALPGPEDKP